MMEELRSTFRPEFLNRIDEMIVFHRLTEQNMYAITQTMLTTLKARFEKLGLHLIVPEETARWLAAEGYDGVIAVMLSGGLSGTYNLMRLMAEDRQDLTIRVFDSVSGSLGMGLTLLQLAEDIRGGADWEELKDFLVEKGYDEKYGARPLRRAVQHSIEDAAAELLLDGRAASGDSIAAVINGGKLKLSVAV